MNTLKTFHTNKGARKHHKEFFKRSSKVLERCFDSSLDEEAIVEVSNSPNQSNNVLQIITIVYYSGVKDCKLFILFTKDYLNIRIIFAL